MLAGRPEEARAQLEAAAVQLATLRRTTARLQTLEKLRVLQAKLEPPGSP